MKNLNRPGRKFREGLVRYGLLRSLSGALRYLYYRIRRAKAYEIVTATDRLRFRFDYPNQVMPSLVMYRELSQSEIEFLRRVLNPGDIFVSAGAGIGCYALFGGKVKRAQVHAFEPFPSNLRTIVHNLQLNGAEENIELNACAVSDHDRGVIIRQTGRTSFNSSISEAEKPVAGLRVESVTLDRYFLSRGIRHIHVLDLDVEGHDQQVLDGAKELLDSEGIDILMIEIHYSFSALYEDILNKGYRAFYYDLSRADLIQIEPMTREHLIKKRPSAFNRRVIMIRREKEAEIRDRIKSGRKKHRAL